MTGNTKENLVDAQVRQWLMNKDMIVPVEEEEIILPFVTISREYGSGGYEIGNRVAELLNGEPGIETTWAAYDKKLLGKIMDDMGLSSSLTDTLTTGARKSLTNFIQTTFSRFPPQVAVYRKLTETIRILASNGSVVIVGRAGNVITKDMPGGFHVRLTAPLDWRVERMAGILGLKKKEAEKIIKEKSNERNRFVKEYVKFDLEDPLNYDLVINNSRYSTDEAAKVVVSAMKIRGLI